MNDIEIIDNFLEPSVFENLKNQMYKPTNGLVLWENVILRTLSNSM